MGGESTGPLPSSFEQLREAYESCTIGTMPEQMTGILGGKLLNQFLGTKQYDESRCYLVSTRTGSTLITLVEE